MCNENSNPQDFKKGISKKIQKLQGLAKALHCPTRWKIIDIIGEKEIKTQEILQEMNKRGKDLSKPGLYYHLSELRDAGIIEVSDYVEEGRGAPEKKWRLGRKEIKIKLTNNF